MHVDDTLMYVRQEPVRGTHYGADRRTYLAGMASIAC